MPKAKTKSSAEILRVGKFGVVGILNTLIDFTIYDVLHSRLGLGLVQSNIFSTSAAMLFSFVANKQVVFEKRQGSVLRQAVIFFAITAFGLYVLQNGVILLLTGVWTGPVHLAVLISHSVGINRYVSDNFVINNSAKAAATVVSLTWNYIMYKKVVFR